MRDDKEMLLNKAIEALQTDEPASLQMDASAHRLADRLGVAMEQNVAVDTIESCNDVRRLLVAYRAGALPSARKLLVDAHLGDCAACAKHFRKGSSEAVNWSAPRTQRATAWRPQRLGWAFAASFAVLACAFFFYRAYWQVPPGVRAEVQSIDGSAYLISGSGDRRLAAGSQLHEGDELRTSGESRAVLKLADGSSVEVNERSVVSVGAKGHNMTVALDQGDAIVQAAKRTSGHLYVRTPDCRVAVTGTVFSVSSGIKGSRVAVLQGDVQVLHGGVRSMLHAGDQLATSDNMSPAPLAQQVAWSQDRDKYLQLASQFSALQYKIAQIPFPQPRYTSDLLNRMPADTLLYVSIPNLGAFLTEANAIFHDQLSQSPALRAWWTSRHDNSAELDAMVAKMNEVSQYLGDEVVIAGVKQAGGPGFAVIADTQRSGLDSVLRQEFAADGLSVLDENALAGARDAAPAHAVLALVRPHEVVFSNSVATLRQVDAQLNAGASGFAQSDFGKQIAAAYMRGAGIVLAADLHGMMNKGPVQLATHSGESSGLESVRYLIAEHRELNGVPQNHLNLQFAGARQRVASWLGAPAPMRSLEFVTPNAAVAVAVLSKDPKSIADDIIAMTTPREGEDKLSQAEEEMQTNLRDGLIGNLGGDFLVSLDGPALPTPSWKAVIEVNDANLLEQTLEKLVAAVNRRAQSPNFRGVSIDVSDGNGQRFYAVRNVATGSALANYTFASGYMIVAPNRALLMDALHAHQSGDSLGRSAAFRALLPKDENENYSAVAYQNLSPVVTPLLSQLSGDAAGAIRKLAADSKPTAICAWGKENRIEAASDSRLFGFDFLTLGALIHSGNQSFTGNVRD